MLVTQSCPALCDPMDCSPPGSSVHGIFQPRILEWVTISFPGNLLNQGIKPAFPGLGRSPGKGNGYTLQILAWRIPWTEEPGGLQSLKSQRVRHDWVTNTSGVLHTGSVYIYICIYTYSHICAIFSQC